MKRIWLFLLVALMVSLLAACEKERNIIPTEIVQAEVKKEDVLLKYNVKAALNEDNNVVVNINLENIQSAEVPINAEDNKIFEVKVFSKDGKNIMNTFISEPVRKEYKEYEAVGYQVQLDLKKYMGEELIIEVRPFLSSTNRFNIEIQSKNVQRIKLPKEDKVDLEEIDFIPKKGTILEYEDKNKKNIKLEFLYFNGNKVQAKTDKKVIFFIGDSNGLYKYDVIDSVGDIDGTEYIDKDMMSMILKYPIEKSNSWESNKASYKVTDQRVKVYTKYKVFKDAVEITEKKGGNIRYLYYHKDYGLIKVKLKQSGIKSSKTELQLIGVKK